MADLIQLKRGSLASWERLNPILNPGEPGFVKDGQAPNILKIGDGSTSWNDLPYVGSSVFNAATHTGFPITGKAGIIYKAENEGSLYQWNPISSSYERLSISETVLTELLKSYTTTEELTKLLETKAETVLVTELTERINTIETEREDFLKLESLGEEFVLNDDGKIEVSSLNMNKLIQTNNDYVVIYGGSASDNI